MKRIPALLFCALFCSSALTGCGDHFQYSGTFDEEVFAHICQDVLIKGASVCVPGTLEDWGDDFSATPFFINQEDSMCFYEVMYEDTLVACVGYAAAEEIPEAELKTTPYFLIVFFETDENPDPPGVAGITLGNSAGSITDALGEPTRITEINENGAYNYEYTVSDEQCIVFGLNDDKLANITIMNQSGG